MRCGGVMMTTMTVGRFSNSSRFPCTDLTTPARQGKRKASEKEQKEAQAKRFEQEARKGRPSFVVAFGDGFFSASFAGPFGGRLRPAVVKFLVQSLAGNSHRGIDCQA